MYIPHHYKNENIKEVRDFLVQNSFGILINTVDGKPLGTHIPLELDVDEDGKDVLMGHIAKANPQWKNFENNPEVLCIFNGPHSYVSSSWYQEEEVPTWNYIAVHVYGKLKTIEGEALMIHLKKLVDKYESSSNDPIKIENLSKNTMKQVHGVVGFQIEIKEIQAAYKLSQGREHDHSKIIQELEERQDSGSKAIAELMKPKKMKRLVSFFALLAFLVSACGQSKQKIESNSETEKKEAEKPQVKDNFMTRMEKEALGQPFNGVFTSEGKENDLFPIRSTGVATKPIKIACEAFMQSLSVDQLNASTFPIDDQEWFKWSNVDNGLYPRQGISIKEMTKDQRTLAYGLLQKSLSAKGLQLSKDIMKTDQTLRELNDDDPIYDEELYYFTIMGTPSDTEPWGWQLDGHHLIINYFVLGDQVVMSPVFMGGEPIITTSGKYKGNTLFQDEQNQGLDFMRSLPVDLQKEATLNPDKARNNISAEAFSDNAVVDYEGLKISKLSVGQKAELLALIHQYISNMEDDHAKIKMEDVEKHFDSTWFSWIGSTDEDAVFYYRVHSPVVLIEFDHQAAIGIRAPRGSGATRNHIHTIVRTPNGNDYGKDLLRQHLEKHH